MAQLRNQVRLVGALVASERWRYACALVALLVGTLLIYLIPLVPTAVLDVVFGRQCVGQLEMQRPAEQS